MDSQTETAPHDEVRKEPTMTEEQTLSSDASDSDDEFYDAVASDENPALDADTQDDKELQQTMIKKESATSVIDHLMQPMLKEIVEDARTPSERMVDSPTSSEDKHSSGSESEDENPDKHPGQDVVDSSRTGETIEPLGDAECSHDGLKAEEEEEAKEVGDEDGSLVIDEDHLRELEEQMTEEEKSAKRQEAQTEKVKGNELFKAGEFADAVYAYSQALLLCPPSYKKDRSIMYANRAACKVKQEHLESAINDCTKALDLNPVYLKVVLRRAQAYELTDKLDEALKDFQRALELDPGCYEARSACMRLPDQIQERNEKLKVEMMSKLKELGNLCLRPFGLSTDNFQLNQDPNTGSYSVNFSQNKGNNGN